MAAKRLAAPAASSGKAVASWRDRAAQSINSSKQQLAKLPQQSGNFLSFRGGTISLGGAPMANPLPVIVLAYGFERSYYARMYQPDVQASPECYSFDGEVPHEQAKTPQADKCAGCRYNEFGSAQNGKGKACKEGARLVLLHADSTKSAQTVADAPIVQARLSVLNSKVFRAFAEAHEDALWACGVVHLSCRPDSKSQYAVGFVGENVVFDDSVMNAIAARVDEAEKLLVQPYPEIEEAAAPARRGVAAPVAAPARKRKF